MKTQLAILLLCTFAVFVAADDCNNPLLHHPNIIARFGQANIVDTPYITGNQSMCFYLTNQRVCVNPAGFSAFEGYLKTWKNGFITDMWNQDQERFSNLISSSNLPSPTTCEAKYQALQLIASTARNYQSQGGNDQVYDFTNAANAFKSANYNLTDAEKYQSDRRVYSMSNIGLLWGNLTRQKADCFRAALKHHIGVTCLAANPAYSNWVGGTSDSPVLNLNNNTCEYFKTYCQPFFFTAKRMKEVRSTYIMCGDPVTDPVVSLLSGTITNQVNQQLTNLSSIILNGNNNDLNYANLQCDDDNLGAGDCDFVCQSAINSTDLNPIVLSTLNPVTRSVTKLTDPTIVVNGDGFRPEAVISDQEVNITDIVPKVETTGASTLTVAFSALVVALVSFLMF